MGVPALRAQWSRAFREDRAQRDRIRPAGHAEDFNILRQTNVGKLQCMEDAETTRLRNPEFYQYELNLPEIRSEHLRRGSVIASWLLDLTAYPLLRGPELDAFAGQCD